MRAARTSFLMALKRAGVMARGLILPMDVEAVSEFAANPAIMRVKLREPQHGVKVDGEPHEEVVVGIEIDQLPCDSKPEFVFMFPPAL